MSNMQENVALGSKIRQIRLDNDLTLEELSNKLQVHWTLLSKIEKGNRKPSVKLLRLLKTTLSLTDEQYQSLLLGISSESGGEVSDIKEASTQEQNIVSLNVPTNLPILFSDSALVNSNIHGIVLNFAQILGNTNQQNVVARIGISLQHAKALQRALSKEISNADKLEAKVKEEESSRN